MLLLAARSSLIALIAIGAYCLYGFSFSNSFFPQVTKLTEAKVTDEGLAYNGRFTGVAAVDDILAVLLTFFWPVCNGKNPYLSIHCVMFAGQFVAAWTVTMVESLRSGRSWRAISFTTTFGLLVQSIGAGIIIPTMLALDLFTSPKAVLSRPDVASLSVAESALQAIPYSIVLGLIIPSVVMSLSSPAILSEQSKVYAIVFWQAFPLWVTITQTLLSSVLPGTSGNKTSRTDSRKSQIKLLRRAYTFALAISVPTHIAVVSLSVLATSFPGLFHPVVVKQLQISYFLIPPNPTSKLQISSVAEGAFWFIQFDYLVTSIAYLVWGMAVKYSCSGSGSKGKQQMGLRGLLGLAVRTALLGPLATVLTSIWERDESVWLEEAGTDHKTQ